MSTGGVVVSAYGYLNCIAPNGVNIRAVVGESVGREISMIAVRAGEEVEEECKEWIEGIEGMGEFKDVPKSRPDGQEEVRCF